MTNAENLSQQLNKTFSSQLLSNRLEQGEVTIEVTVENYLSVCKKLRDDDVFAFEILIDLCGVDYSAYGQDECKTDASKNGFSRGIDVATHGRLRFGDELPEMNSERKRFAAVVHLLSIKNNHRLRVRVYAEDDAMPVVPSIVELWNGGNWFEREAFDLYGIHL